jgi:hypothetical protein
MKSNIPSVPMPFGIWLRIWLSLLTLSLAGNVWAARYQDIDLNACGATDVTLAATLNTPAGALTCEGFSSGCDIATANASGNVYWTFANDAGNNGLDGNSNCTGTAPDLTCAGIKLTLPAGTDVLAPATQKALLSNDSLLSSGARSYFYLTVANEAGTAECTRHYRFGVTSGGGGWGDPHITTVDGIHYDFQSAGEFVALRGGGIEIQTRQARVATTSAPLANSYTGLTSCVSLYSAVAARVGKHRVSYQQSSTNPEVMELRVDGVLTTLGSDGINLESQPISVGVENPKIVNQIVKPAEEIKLKSRNVLARPSAAMATPKIGGRVVKAATGEGIEIHYVDGTKVVVTQAWWNSQQKWYLNVDVYETTASEGIMGRTRDNWLPALADGSSVGPKPNVVHDRYTELYKTFADSWRVTNATSLFDYAPGTSTQTFTFADWPRESPTTCTIGNQIALQSVGAAVAQAQCKALVDENAKADCIFDVMATGHTGFANTYLIQQKLRGVTSIRQRAIEKVVRGGERVTFIVPKGLSPRTRLVQFIVDGKNFGAPVQLDATGQAVFSTSNLPTGKHRIEMKFVKPSLRGIGTEMNRIVVPAQPKMR